MLSKIVQHQNRGKNFELEQPSQMAMIHYRYIMEGYDGRVRKTSPHLMCSLLNCALLGVKREVPFYVQMPQTIVL